MNLVLIHGRLTRDPEVKTTQSGLMIARLTVAVDRVVKKGEERKADFLNCVAFSHTAEVIAQYCTKGKEIVIQGRLQTSTYQTEDGEKRYKTEIIIDRFEFCGSAKDGKKAEVEAQESIPF